LKLKFSHSQKQKHALSSVVRERMSELPQVTGVAPVSDRFTQLPLRSHTHTTHLPCTHINRASPHRLPPQMAARTKYSWHWNRAGTHTAPNALTHYYR